MPSEPAHRRRGSALAGSHEFELFLSAREIEEPGTDTTDGIINSPRSSHEPALMGVYESTEGDGQVMVRLDDTGEIVKARLAGFSPEYRFEPGDELAVEVVDGEWQTLPNVRHTIAYRDRVDFWSRNRWTRRFRLLDSVPNE